MTLNPRDSEGVHPQVRSRHGPQVQALLHAMRSTDGATPVSLRDAVMNGQPTGSAIDAYVDLVRFGSYAISADHIQDLAAQGWSEDAIFEVTIAAAVSESHRRLVAALDALTAAGS